MCKTSETTDIAGVVVIPVYHFLRGFALSLLLLFHFLNAAFHCRHQAFQRFWLEVLGKLKTKIF